MNVSDQATAEAILALLNERGAGKSICPSEVARRLDTESGDAWRDLMPSVRRVGRDLADRGLLSVTQKGQTVDPETAKGPIRFRRKSGVENAARSPATM